MSSLQNTIQQLQEVQEGGSWLGESFKSKIDGLADEEALARPIPQVHSVAELVWHVLVWRKECMQRIRGIRTDLMNSPDNWKGNDALKALGWPGLKQAFYDNHAELLQLLKTLTDADLQKQHPGSDRDNRHLTEGILQHDVYHLGQIGISIKLLLENKQAAGR